MLCDLKRLEFNFFIKVGNSFFYQNTCIYIIQLYFVGSHKYRNVMKNAIWHEKFQSCLMKIMDFYIYLIDLSCTFSCQTKQLRSCVKLQFFSHFAIEVFIQHFCIRMSTNAHFIYQGIINQYICHNSLFIVVFRWTKNHSQAYEYMPSNVS